MIVDMGMRLIRLALEAFDMIAIAVSVLLTSNDPSTTNVAAGHLDSLRRERSNQ